MPCHVDPPSPIEYNQQNEVSKQLQEVNAKASRGADMLREYLLGNMAAERVLPVLNQKLGDDLDKLESLDRTHWLHVNPSELELARKLVHIYEELNTFATLEGPEKLTGRKKEKVEKEQIAHRKEDLKRLIKTFALSGEDKDMDRIRKVLDADPTRPLAAQLGFDPDEF